MNSISKFIELLIQVPQYNIIKIGMDKYTEIPNTWNKFVGKALCSISCSVQNGW